MGKGEEFLTLQQLGCHFLEGLAKENSALTKLCQLPEGRTQFYRIIRIAIIMAALLYTRGKAPEDSIRRIFAMNTEGC